MFTTGFVLVVIALIVGGVYTDLNLWKKPSSDGPAWGDFWEEAILGMPAAAAVGVSVCLVVLLMIVTHMIESRNKTKPYAADFGDSLSWAVATLIILTICGLGMFYGLQPRFGAYRWAILLLCMLVFVLFIFDGLEKGRKLCVFLQTAQN